MDFLELTAACNENKMEGSKIMVFDWQKAADIIINNDLENVEAFIRGDEMRTAGLIIYKGQMVADHKAILESYIAPPSIRDCDTGREWLCYKLRPATNWTASVIFKLGKEIILNENMVEE